MPEQTLIWSDTHAHLFDKAFSSDQKEVLDRSFEHQVKRIYMPNLTLSSVESMLRLAASYPENCFPALGLHPCYVQQNYAEQLKQMEPYLGRAKYVAIGETGLDSHRGKELWQSQQAAFHTQCRWALEYQLPVVLHSRGEQAMDTLLQLIQTQYPTLKGVFHCFCGTEKQAEQALDLGFYLGIGGMITYTHGKELRAMLEKHPDWLSRLLLETDAPYLAPSGAKTRRNEPAYIPLVGKQVAKRMRKDLAQVARQTTQNAIQLFGI